MKKRGNPPQDEAINRFWQKVETDKDQMWILGVWKKSEQILKTD